MRLTFLAAAAAIVCSLSAHAESVTYAISGNLNTNYNVTVTGMTTLDIFVQNPSVQSISLNFSNGTSQTGIGTKGQDGSNIVYVGADNDMFTFTDNLHNYTLAGGTFNLVDISGDYVGQVFNGKLTVVPPAVTPEPSSLALLATGVLGVAGVVRKRLV